MSASLGMFLPGINWGLPSRAVDAYLFGNHPVWPGAKIAQLAGPTEDADRGADVASHGAIDRRYPTAVNYKEDEQARIIRRYRLMSYQPDEWNTLKALSEMKPARGKFDPKLYQYGGLWVYPVGGLLKLASLARLIDLRSDVTWYLDHPEAFGRFYVVARLYSVAWGVVGVGVVFALVRRITGGAAMPAVAAGCFMCMPVVVNMAHEAKPHLAGAVLMLLAVWAAANFVEHGSRRWARTAGIFCGAAQAMVLSSLPIFLVLPAMLLLRKLPWRQRLLWLADTLLLAALVYAISNPYVIVNAIWHRQALASNLGNSRAMYRPHLNWEGILNAVYLVEAGASPLLALAGAVGAVALGRRAITMRGNTESADRRRRATGLLLALPGLFVLGQAVLVAAGKPGEFGRFLLFADVFLMIEAVAAVGTFVEPRYRPALSAVLLAGALAGGGLYLRGFWRDSQPTTSRLKLAEELASLGLKTKPGVAIFADPAPYCLPPINLFEARLVLMPAGATLRGGAELLGTAVEAVDAPGLFKPVPNPRALLFFTPISWADKPFELRQQAATGLTRSFH